VRLSEEALSVLTIAALVGREFDYQVLMELTGKEEDELLELLDGVVASRLIEEVSGAVGKYRFHHGLTREVLTSELSTTRRVRLHGRIAEALERAYNKDVEKHAAELAYHYGQAATLSGAQEKAVRYSALAARNSEAAYAYEEVIRHYEAALGLMEETDNDFGQDPVALRRGLAVAQRSVYRNTDAFRNFRRARQDAHDRGDGQAVAELALEQVQTGLVPPDVIVRALTMGLQAVPDPESELAAMLHVHLVNPLEGLQREEEAREHYEGTLELATSHNYANVELELAMVALQSAANRLDLVQAPVLDRRLDELEGKLGRTMLWFSNVRSWWRLHAGDVAGARAQAQRHLEQARRARDTYNINRLLTQLGAGHLFLGEFTEALRVCDLSEGQEQGDLDFGIETVRSLAAEALGDLNEARSRMAPVVEIQRRQRRGAHLDRAAVLLSVERRLGNHDRSNALYNDVVGALNNRKAAKIGAVSLHALIAPEAVVRNDVDVISSCREVLAPHEGITGIRVGDTPTSVTVGRVLGILAAANKQWDEAIGYLDRATVFCLEKGMPVELAHCRMALADALNGRNGTGDHQKAGVLLDQALTDYQRLGMPLYVQEVLSRKGILKA